MRFGLISILAAGFFCMSCSHDSAKSDTAAPAAASHPAAAKETGEKASLKTDKSSPAAGETKVECIFKNDSRLIESRAKEKGCELAYTKSGNEAVVASSQNGSAYCEKAMAKLEDKLKASGYECK